MFARLPRAWARLSVGVAVGGLGAALRVASGPALNEWDPNNPTGAQMNAVPTPKGRQGWVPTPLEGRIAVVTGSSQGIGAGIALELAHAGADVVINYVGDKQADKAPALDVADEVRKIGRRALVVRADVSRRSEVEAMFDEAEKALGPVNILVTNAVVSTRANILETKIEDFELTLGVGLMGVFHCMQTFSRRMVASELRNGSIIHICSPHTRGPFKDCIDYNVTKAAAHHLALSAANELMWSGIRVNMVQPGWTLTEGELRLYGKKKLDHATSQMPLGRLSMPEDIGKAAVWLCSDEAAYVTGATITVDGGQFIESAPSWTSTYSANKKPLTAK
jgi:glucose 1-dehydrogenase